MYLLDIEVINNAFGTEVPTLRLLIIKSLDSHLMAVNTSTVELANRKPYCFSERRT